MLNIRCRLNQLLGEREISPDALAASSGLTVDRIIAYCDENIDSVSLREVAALLEALGSDQLSDLFEPFMAAGEGTEEEPVYEDDWETPCAATPDGKHSWYRDVTASSMVYQEYFCSACRHRFAFIL